MNSPASPRGSVARIHDEAVRERMASQADRREPTDKEYHTRSPRRGRAPSRWSFLCPRWNLVQTGPGQRARRARPATSSAVGNATFLAQQALALLRDAL